MRVVLDTNVLISAFVFPGGVPELVYRQGLEGRITLITSRPLLSELGRVLTEKFGWEAPYTEEAVNQFLRIAVVVDATDEIADVAEDPADNRVLEAAAAGEAELIISGDRHLLALRSWRGILVLTPAAAINELQQRSPRPFPQRCKAL